MRDFWQRFVPVCIGLVFAVWPNIALANPGPDALAFGLFLILAFVELAIAVQATAAAVGRRWPFRLCGGLAVATAVLGLAATLFWQACVLQLASVLLAAVAAYATPHARRCTLAAAVCLPLILFAAYAGMTPFGLFAASSQPLGAE